MSHESKKRERVEWIMKEISSANCDDKNLSEEKLIALASLHFGAGRRYIKEIVYDLILTEKLILIEENIYIKSIYDKILSDFDKNKEEEKCNNLVEEIGLNCGEYFEEAKTRVYCEKHRKKE